MNNNVVLLASSAYLPSKVVRNDDFTNFPKVALPLIESKIGILQRRHVDKTQKVSDIAIICAQECMQKSNISCEQVDCVICATSTPDRLIPSTAARIQDALGLRNAFAFDMNAACSNGVYSMELARSLIIAGSANTVIVINADVLSKFCNPRDFSTYPYFGDGAGCVILQRQSESSLDKPILLPAVLYTDGAGYDIVSITGGGSEMPFSQKTRDEDFYVHMNGSAIMNFALTRVPEVVSELCKKHNIKKDDISTLILHQANHNIILKLSSLLNVPISKIIENIKYLGNTAGASLLIAISQYFDSKRYKSGFVVICGFGAGLCWGASALKFPKTNV